MIKVYSADNKGLGFTKLGVPKIIGATWESETINYGQKARLTIKTKEALTCMIVVKISSYDWEPGTRFLSIFEVKYKLTDTDGNHFDGIQCDFTPETEFLKEGSMTKNEMNVHIWLLYPFVEKIRVNSWFEQNRYLFEVLPTIITPLAMEYDTKTVTNILKYPKGTEAIYFTDKNAAYKYMWDNSLVDGVATREVSAWELKNGNVIVLPYDKNTLNESHNNALPISTMNANGTRYVQYKGTWHAISGHAHTHPTMGTHLGLSDGDYKMFVILNGSRVHNKIPLTILYNKSIYSSIFNTRTKLWNSVNKGTW